MFFRWLVEVFPADMRRGWALVRRDIVLWVAIATLTSLAMMAVPPLDSIAPRDFFAIVVSLLALLAPFMLAPVLFAAEAQGRQYSWGPLLRHMASRLPINLACQIASFLAFAELARLAGTAVLLALQGFVAAELSATVVQFVITLTLLSQFVFLPFVINLYRRDELPAELWEWKRAAPLGPVLWPFTASSRLSDGRRWRIAPYVFLELLIPAVAMKAGALTLPAFIAAQVAQVVLRAVLFHYFLSQLQQRGAPQPRIPD
ncbi:MAG TPA: hypothetical protein VEL28_16260 [Candidatus Binatia bacterium]|nr:hypothetical protein [Candidatus Binatia bacterium]